MITSITPPNIHEINLYRAIKSRANLQQTDRRQPKQMSAIGNHRTAHHALRQRMDERELVMRRRVGIQADHIGQVMQFQDETRRLQFDRRSVELTIRRGITCIESLSSTRPLRMRTVFTATSSMLILLLAMPILNRQAVAMFHSFFWMEMWQSSDCRQSSMQCVDVFAYFTEWLMELVMDRLRLITRDV